MVHLEDKGREGLRGSLVLHGDDGSIISSSGDLASSEQAAQTIVNLLNNTLTVDFAPQTGENGHVNQAVVNDNGGAGDRTGLVTKWNRLTVSFEDRTYVACLSNKRIHVVKKDGTQPQEPDQNNE